MIILSSEGRKFDLINDYPGKASIIREYFDKYRAIDKELIDDDRLTSDIVERILGVIH